MTLSEKSMAAVLLCTYIGIPDDSEIKPFTPGEWEKLETVIGQKGLKIENVIDDPQILLDCGYEQSDVDRVLFLKSRGVNIALTLDKYESRGIKVITVFDEKYPPLLRRKLKLKSPAVLLYAGNIELIHKVGIGIALAGIVHPVAVHSILVVPADGRNESNGTVAFGIEDVAVFGKGFDALRR